MKSLKTLMMAVLTILTISVVAQNSTIKSPKEQLSISKKEQMKMEVMKIQYAIPNYITTGDYSKGAFVSSLSPKEQMKRNVMKLNSVNSYQDVAVNKSGKCPVCLNVLNLSPKEQMKMKVMDLYNCPMSSGSATDKAGKCSICGMDLTAVKNK